MSNPLHPPLPSDQYSGYSSLSNALMYQCNNTTRPLERQSLYTTRKMVVPQQPSIMFDLTGHNEKGVKMSDLLANDCSCFMAGGDDRVFGRDDRKINLRIFLREYGVLGRTPLPVRAGQTVIHITRAGLGNAVARIVFKHLSDTCGWSIRPDQLILFSVKKSSDDWWVTDIHLDSR